MADKRISELTEIGELASNDFIPLVDTSVNETKKVSAGTLFNFIQNSIVVPPSGDNQIIQGNTSVTVTDTGSNGKAVIAIDGTDRVTVDSSGNVGIGLTNPSGLLDVANRGITKGSLPAGTVLQVVQATYNTEVVIATSSFTDSGLSATITPSSASSKILVMVSQPMESFDVDNYISSYMRILRGASTIYTATSAFGQFTIYVDSATELAIGTIAAVNYLDSPSTTSATTYKTQFNCASGSVTLQSQNAKTATLILMEIAG